MALLAAAFCTIATAAPGQVGQPGEAPGYVGSETCVGCHRAAGEAWTTSHHARAWHEPTEQSVHGDFDGKTFEHRGVVSRFSKGGGKFVVTTDGPDGQSRKFDVVGTVGIAPLQQYLVETDPGRQQVLDLAWDTERRRWYHLYPDQDLPHTDGLHWTGPYKNWNARCAECHATGYQKRYAPLTRRYSSMQAEKSVGCEACHGPGSAHVTWTRDRSAFNPSAWRGVKMHGLTVSFEGKNAETEIQQCAGCHSRREAFADASPIAGTPFHDSYRLALLRDGLYHADGQIRDEVYVYGSFLQSKMYARGVRCTDCHNPHSGALKAQGNAVCTQCHNPSGKPGFPTLKQAEYDTPKHHFHKPGSVGAQCKGCHMIERVYMRVDGRRDHSFRVPRPDLSAALGTPNACTDCHENKPTAWASAELASRFPDSSHRGTHHATTFTAARQGSGDAAIADSLLEIGLSRNNAGIVRATALDLLQRYAAPQIADRAAGLLRDPDPLVRAAAIPLQRAKPPATRVQRLGPLLQDERRSVRIAAVRALLDILAGRAPPTLARSARQAIGEYQRSLSAKADFPEIQMAIAGTAMVSRKFRVAERAFSEAARMDPQRVDAWAMVARLRAAQGDIEGAKKALRDGLAANPNDANLVNILQNLQPSNRPN
jgi:predicted CXXCH cytochrome family protein